MTRDDLKLAYAAKVAQVPIQHEVWVERVRAAAPLTRKAYESAFNSFVAGKRNCRGLHLSYSRDDLRCHIERQFTKGMSWSNRGFKSRLKPVWHIDHIRPKSSFAVDDLAAAYALSNLRPLWSKDNLEKGTRRLLLA